MSQPLPDDDELNPCETATGSFLSVKRTATIALLCSAVWLASGAFSLDDFNWNSFGPKESSNTDAQLATAESTTTSTLDPITNVIRPPSSLVVLVDPIDESYEAPPLPPKRLLDDPSVEPDSNSPTQVADDSPLESIASFQVRRARRPVGGIKEPWGSRPNELATEENAPAAGRPPIAKVSYVQPVAEPSDAADSPDADRPARDADRIDATDRIASSGNNVQLVSQPNAAPARENLPLPAGVDPFEVIEEVGEIRVTVRRSKILQLKKPIFRNAIVDPGICDIVQFTPTQLSIIGRSLGTTHLTFWFEGETRPQTFLVTVEPDAAVKALVEREYQKLEDIIAELFPDSKVHLTVMADKVVVRGQAKCAEDAANILAMIRNGQGGGGGGGAGGAGGIGGAISSGTAARVLFDGEGGGNASNRPQLQLINMLRVPGIHQVALRVKIAEINRTAARGFGVDLGGHVNFSKNPQGSQVFLNSLLGMATGAASGGNSLLFQVDGDDVTIGIRYLQQHGIVRLLSEPTLVTMSGIPATFVAGGEFAVPTIVGSAGLNAVTTDFRSFGAIVSFLPTVVDKDRIRLQISPEFSQINSALTVGNTPGLNTRSVNTTVEMREGQTLAIAGLLEDDMKSSNKGIYPFLYPWIGQRDTTRNETELLILVTPELIHPMDPEEVPPLPGFDMTEPDNWQFYVGAQLEGNPTRNHRSTVWPRLLRRYNAGGPAMISGPFGHGQ